jgi:hypothetical protein
MMMMMIIISFILLFLREESKAYAITILSVLPPLLYFEPVDKEIPGMAVNNET